MVARVALVAGLAIALVASEAVARNPAYYGTRRGTSARYYSGQYQAQFPNRVPTYSLPVYGGGFRTYYRGGFYGRGIYRPIAPQPLVIYGPPVVFGVGF